MRPSAMKRRRPEWHVARAWNPLGFFRRLHADEGGAGLLFGALTLLVAVAVVAMTANVWELLRAKVRAQNAADAVAYSAAAAVANALSLVASLNGTLVWIYRAALGIVAATISSGVLAALNVVLPGAFSWAVPMFHQSLSVAEAWLPRLTAWARAVARLQDGIVREFPAVAEAEAIRIARANGASLGVVAPPPRLPLARETNVDRFLRRVGGGVVPAWALKHLFPAAAGGTFRRTGTRIIPVRRHGRSGHAREDVTLGEEDVGLAAAQDPKTAGLYARFKRVLADVRNRPLPLPLVLTGAYGRMELQAAVWTEADAVRRRMALGGRIFPWPAAAKGFLTLAAAEPRHPRIDPLRVAVDPENLYRVDGWEIVWRPVDLAALRRWAGAGGLLRRAAAVERLGDMIQH